MISRSAIALSAALVSSCQQQAETKQAEVDKPAAVLLVHWADGGDGYSHEYPDMDACDVAKGILLHDYAQRGYLNAKAQIESNTEALAEPRPIAVCIPA